MPLTIQLRKGEKARQEKVPIALNSVLDFYRQSRSDLQHKGNLVILQVHTAHIGIGANLKQAGTSFRKKTAQNIDRIENKSLSVIVTLLMIYQEVLPSMIDVGPITPWGMFKMLCTGTEVTEFNKILFKASGEIFEFNQADFNKNICLIDEKSKEVKAWKEKTISRIW